MHHPHAPALALPPVSDETPSTMHACSVAAPCVTTNLHTPCAAVVTLHPLPLALAALAKLYTSALLTEASTERYRSMSRRLADLGEVVDMTTAKATLRNMAAALEASSETGTLRTLSHAASSTSAMERMPGAHPRPDKGVSSSNPFLSHAGTSPRDSRFHIGSPESAPANPFRPSSSVVATPAMLTDVELRRRSESNPTHPRPTSTGRAIPDGSRLVRTQSDGIEPAATAIVMLQAKRTSWTASEDSLAGTSDDGLELTLQPSSPAQTEAAAETPSTLTRPPSHRNLLSPPLEVLTPTGSTLHSRSTSPEPGVEEALGVSSAVLKGMSLNIVVSDDKPSPTFLRRPKRGNSQVNINARFVPSRDSMYLDDMDVTTMLAEQDAAVKAEVAAGKGAEPVLFETGED